MKTLFESPSRLVKYALTMVAFFVALGIIFASVFGFNTSTEYNGYYEISIDSFDAEQEEKIDNAVKAVLSEYEYTVSEKIVEDRDYCETLVYRYRSNSTQNAEQILNKLTTTLSLNDGMINVQKLQNAYNGITTIKYLVLVAVVTVVLFLVALIRGGVKYGLAVTSSNLITTLLSMAIIAFTRVLLTKSLVVITLLFALVGTLITINVLGKIKDEKENNKSLSYKDAYMLVCSKASLTNKIVLACGLAIVPIALALTFNYTLVMLAVGYVICALVALFASLIIAPAIFVLINDYQEQKIQKVVSRNTKNKK